MTKKMERKCHEEEIQPYRKMDYKPIIIISSATYDKQHNINFTKMVVILMGLICISRIIMDYDVLKVRCDKKSTRNTSY